MPETYVGVITGVRDPTPDEVHELSSIWLRLGLPEAEARARAGGPVGECASPAFAQVIQDNKALRGWINVFGVALLAAIVLGAH